MSKHLTDGDVVRIARRIDEFNRKIDDLIYQITDSDHPNAERMGEDLLYQCSTPAWAAHIVHDYLTHSERWESGDYGIRRAMHRTDQRTDYVGLCEFEALLD